jgi:hypothetical protein
MKEHSDYPFSKKKDADQSDSSSGIAPKKHQSEVHQSRQLSSYSGDHSIGRKGNRSGSQASSRSPPIKVYDPIKAEQDKVLKKKEREDYYHSQHITEEPLLLIKKREIITKYINPSEEAEPLTTSTLIKKSDKSKYVDVDYATAKRKIAELAVKEYHSL